jgi:hypothetical protein
MDIVMFCPVVEVQSNLFAETSELITFCVDILVFSFRGPAHASPAHNGNEMPFSDLYSPIRGCCFDDRL